MHETSKEELDSDSGPYKSMLIFLFLTMIYEQQNNDNTNFKWIMKSITCHPSGLRSIKRWGKPVSKSVQLMVPSEDDVYTVPSFAGLNLHLASTESIIAK